MYIIKEASVYNIETAWQELSRYNMDAGRKLNTDVISYFQEFLPKQSIEVYRGLGFNPAEAASLLKKFKIKEMKVGAKIKYQTGKIQSWSLNINEAKQFMGLHSIVGLDDSSLGILLKIRKLKPEQIAVPIAFLPTGGKRKYIKYDQSEILTLPGSFEAEVVEFFGDWSNFNLKDDILITALEMKKKYGCEIGKTWDKRPGFSMDLKNIYIDKKWSPSIAVSIDTDNSVYIENFSGKKEIKSDTRIFKASSKQETTEILKSKDFLSDIDRRYNLIKKAYGK